MANPIVDIDKCILCEICAEWCPDVFRVNESGFIEVAELENYPQDCIREAAVYCPEDCITIKE